MGDNPLSELLNRLLHDEHARTDDVRVIVVHRGAPDDRLEIPGSTIAHVRHRALELDNGTEIPLHRVIEVRRAGELVWPPPTT